MFELGLSILRTLCQLVGPICYWPRQRKAKHGSFTWSRCEYWESLPDLMAMRAFLWES